MTELSSLDARESRSAASRLDTSWWQGSSLRYWPSTVDAEDKAEGFGQSSGVCPGTLTAQTAGAPSTSVNAEPPTQLDRTADSWVTHADTAPTLGSSSTDDDVGKLSTQLSLSNKFADSFQHGKDSNVCFAFSEY